MQVALSGGYSTLRRFYLHGHREHQPLQRPATFAVVTKVANRRTSSPSPFLQFRSVLDALSPLSWVRLTRKLSTEGKRFFILDDVAQPQYTHPHSSDVQKLAGRRISEFFMWLADDVRLLVQVHGKIRPQNWRVVYS